MSMYDSLYVNSITTCDNVHWVSRRYILVEYFDENSTMVFHVHSSKVKPGVQRKVINTSVSTPANLSLYFLLCAWATSCIWIQHTHTHIYISMYLYIYIWKHLYTCIYRYYMLIMCLGLDNEGFAGHAKRQSVDNALKSWGETRVGVQVVFIRGWSSFSSAHSERRKAVPPIICRILIEMIETTDLAIYIHIYIYIYICLRWWM
jgi:hypothetical protein